MERRKSPRRSDRRGANRARLGGVFFNKYIDGIPHLVSLVDLSPDGMMVQKLLEPDAPRAFYAIEIEVPWDEDEEGRLWIWTRRVRDLGDRQALAFVGLTEKDRARLEAVVHEARRVA
jgi:hypothetical protein